jgi:nucleoside-diphosphate-sugar epimerase
MGAPGAFDEVVKGATGFIHVAKPVMQSTDPNKAVPTGVKGILNTLDAAATEPRLKRVVMTSSSTAATRPKPNVDGKIDEKTWNEEDVEAAWKPPPYKGHERMSAVYAATKKQSEEAVWKWMETNQPNFVLNAILPNANMGKVLSPDNQGTPRTVGWPKARWDGFEGHEDLKNNPPQYYVYVQDTARCHVAALLSADVKS